MHFTGRVRSGTTLEQDTPVITVSDGTDVTSESFTWNLDSAISLGTINNIQDTAGNSVSVSVSATDSNSLSLTYSASDLPDGVSIDPTSGLITGTIVAGEDDGSTETPIITVSDGTSETSESLTWTVGPITEPSSYDTQENTALTVVASLGVLSVDTAPPGTTLTATVLTEPSDGSLSLAANGSLVYTPDSGWVGIDSFTYVASDGQVDSAPVTVTIQTDLTVSSTNYVAVATGDFNGDGNTDFVAVNQGSNDVAVYYGNGDGTFQTTPTVISVGNGPDAVVVGKFGNGADDIAVANGTDGTVTILLNNGSGTFTTSQTLTVGTDPVALALGDFEGNGRLDLAVVNKGSDTVSVFLNNGTGTFSLDTTLSVGTSPTSVAAADLNGAGYDDLVVANSGDNNISVFLSNGNGTFASAVNYSVGTAPSAVVAADFTGNGIIDVAVANSGSSTVSVFLGNGDGTLGTATSYAVGSNPVAMVAADIAGYGSTDLAVVNTASNNETILTNNGTGIFTATQTISLTAGTQSLAIFTQANMVYEVSDGWLTVSVLTTQLAIQQAQQVTQVTTKPPAFSSGLIKLPGITGGRGEIIITPNVEIKPVGAEAFTNDGWIQLSFQATNFAMDNTWHWLQMFTFDYSLQTDKGLTPQKGFPYIYQKPTRNIATGRPVGTNVFYFGDQYVDYTGTKTDPGDEIFYDVESRLTIRSPSQLTIFDSPIGTRASVVNLSPAKEKTVKFTAYTLLVHGTQAVYLVQWTRTWNWNTTTRMWSAGVYGPVTGESIFELPPWAKAPKLLSGYKEVQLLDGGASGKLISPFEVSNPLAPR